MPNGGLEMSRASEMRNTPIGGVKPVDADRPDHRRTTMTEKKLLTRDEADDIAQVHGMSVAFVDTLVALGILEVSEPVGGTALDKIQRTINENWSHAKNFTEALEKRGLKIQEK